MAQLLKCFLCKLESDPQNPCKNKILVWWCVLAILILGKTVTGTSLVLAGWPASLAKSANLKPVKDPSQIRR